MTMIVCRGATPRPSLITKTSKLVFPFVAGTLLLACLLTGCQTSRAGAPPVGIIARPARSNAYSLLHQLLDDEKDISLLHFIKQEPTDLKDLMKRIAAASKKGAKLLEQFAREDPAINLKDIGLPPAEVATRDAIAATKKKELLTQTGDSFELTLLLSQTEALNYGWHLAKIAAQTEPQPDRIRAMTDMGDQMEDLYREVFRLLLSRLQSPEMNRTRSQAQ